MPIHKGLNGAKFLLSLLVIVVFAYMMVYADKFFLEEEVSIINPIFVQESVSDLASIDLRTLEIVEVEGNEGGVLQYVVQGGDSLGGIAAKFGTTIAHLKKINNIGNNPIRPGQKLVVTEEQEGFIHTLKEKTSIGVFADTYGLSKEDLMSLNYIQDETEILHVGQELFINLSLEQAYQALLLERPKPKPVVVKKPVITQTRSPSSQSNATIRNPNTSPASTISSNRSSSNGKILARWTYNEKVNNGFYAGYCTRYAAIISPGVFGPVVDGKQERPFGGNANQWYANAKAAGFSVGQTPRVGAIIVYSNLRSSAGHVGKVISYDAGQGEMVIRDMNYAGKFIVTERTESVNRSGIIGYIYPR